jgi:hypothetical protein
VSGVVIGGFKFVIAAYVISTIVLGGYVLSVLVRLRQERRAAKER